ncbi:potassium-transporting ATPase subunit KdpC [Aeromicrobium chenweiae]|uniref:Potassium-transporting ATPase KdpC subunit n=1 Tax=Aeromicrobium chenweiae TaxID=2079793 RepID=A0A2S0WK26_9ACTN|nr:potassium-transporting ATPase subunit KdpC [Aeromicrobium chenweiae]AWB91624.1 potassium-transporting ATPase subunit C [Aeromicrobium chenweiae]TGN32463.1 potassium-transporting ATPase subunit KdpC [Aeromicrobium chenweiae]
MSADFFRQSLVGLKVMLVMTLLLGVVYPAAVWGVGQIAWNDRASGQIVSRAGQDVGSRIIGQDFPVDGDGWFHGRPSAAGYDGLASAASNLGPSNPDLLETIRKRQAEIARVEGVAVSAVPADAVTASASGLDPHISPAYAALQVERVARERGLPVQKVRALVEGATDGRQLGFLGRPTVNVLELNLALARE